MSQVKISHVPPPHPGCLNKGVQSKKVLEASEEPMTPDKWKPARGCISAP